MKDRMDSMKNFVQPSAFSLQSFFSDLPLLSAFLIGRVSGLELPTDRHEALKAQIPFFKKTVKKLLPEATIFCCAGEVHGTDIVVIDKSTLEQDLIPGVDGMMTNEPGIALGITVADCAPVWIFDQRQHAVALVHSGKRGTEAGILPKAIQLLEKNFSSQPQDLIVTIGPCIRPPCYEVDIGKMIREQAAQAGVGEIRDEEICTGCDLEKYYSYRREKGRTGHMLALAMLQSRNSLCD